MTPALDFLPADIWATRASLRSPVTTFQLQGMEAISPGIRGMEFWLVDLFEYPAERLSEYLSELEIARAARYRFSDDRRRYRASHCALRDVIGRLLGRAPGSLLFHENRYGKPMLAAGSEGTPNVLHFNLSHSRDQALIGISDDLEIGVDIELLRELDDIEPLAEQNLTAHEQTELAAMPCHDRTLAFLRGWTRKEACLKAVGCGLSIPPNSFYAGLSDTQTLVTLETSDGKVSVCVQTMDVGTGAVGAVAWVAPLQAPWSN